MHLSNEIIAKSVRVLRQTVHPFLGITFLACKRFRLPEGGTSELSLDSLTNAHLQEFHRVYNNSEFFFQPFKSSSHWLSPRYASTGLQAVNTQTFISAFLHPRGKASWGWVDNYQYVIADTMSTTSATRAPLWALACWILRDQYIAKPSISEVEQQFVDIFDINEKDLARLFEVRNGSGINEAAWFSDQPPVPSKYLPFKYSIPPDAPKENGAALRSIEVKGVGPSDQFTVKLGRRLTIATGDNGLGKSFLLECAWYGATGSWSKDVYPNFNGKRFVDASISWKMYGEAGGVVANRAAFDSKSQSWKRKSDDTLSGIVLYSKADGSASLFDPNRLGQHKSIHLTRDEIWYGSRNICSGMIHDIIDWQRNSKRNYLLFQRCLEVLSPSDLKALSLGPGIRVPTAAQRIPTISFPYGEVPVTDVSAGVQRVLQLVYMVVWLVSEHQRVSESQGIKPLERILVIVDELEAHLHPRWQRTVMPTLMSALRQISEMNTAQLIVATHSPLVMASLEQSFSEDYDEVVGVQIHGNVVDTRSIPFRKHGDVSAWLTSDAFGLGSARSREAERALKDAKNLQLNRSRDVSAIMEVHSRLVDALPDDDQFWPRWIYFVEKSGVEL